MKFATLAVTLTFATLNVTIGAYLLNKAVEPLWIAVAILNITIGFFLAMVGGYVSAKL